MRFYTVIICFSNWRKKMIIHFIKKSFFILSFLCLISSPAFCSERQNVYDANGFLTGWYITDSSGNITEYDKTGSIVGTYRKTSSGYNHYDSNNVRTETIRETSNGGFITYDSNNRITSETRPTGSGYNIYNNNNIKTESVKIDSKGRATVYDKTGRPVKKIR